MGSSPQWHESAELAAEFVALNDQLRSAEDQPATLQRLVELAVATVPGCSWAAITAWPEGKEPCSLASVGLASEVDQLQYRLLEGPCLSASTDVEMVRIADIAEEKRWPAFCTAAAAQTPVRGVLSLHLIDAPQCSALNLYSAEAGAFGDEAVGVAALFAAHARALLLHAASTADAANLQRALSTSRKIGAAIGILMVSHKITEQQAFDLLRISSQHLNRKLRDIADSVTRTGTLPDGG